MENISIHGWRARIGLILPSANVYVEPEFYKMAPEGVTFHSARVPFTTATTENLMAMSKDVDKAAEHLAGVVDAVGFGCTAGTFIQGVEGDKALSERIRKVTGVPTVTTSMAVVDALKELKIYKVAIATPYIEELNRKEKVFLEGLGFKVLAIKGMGFLEKRDFMNCPIDIPYRLAREVNDPEADAVFISCTGWKTLSIIGRLEKDLDKPVISSNQALFHAVLKAAGINEKIDGYGKLLSG